MHYQRLTQSKNTTPQALQTGLSNQELCTHPPTHLPPTRPARKTAKTFRASLEHCDKSFGVANLDGRVLFWNQAGRHPRFGSCNDEFPLIEGWGPSYFPSCAEAFASARLPAISTAASKCSARPAHTYHAVERAHSTIVDDEQQRGVG